MGIFVPPKITKSNFANTIVSTKKLEDFNYILNKNINDIILFENTNESEDYTNKITLPRNYFIFVGTKDNELQFKPYEYNPYRIVVSTYNNIIIEINSIG